MYLSQPKLFKIAEALNAVSLLAGCIQSRQEHRRKNRDDCYDDEKLYESENTCFHPANEEHRTGSTEGRSRKTSEQSNIGTSQQLNEERENKAGRELTPP